jgi:hypothetical protein
MCDLFHGHKVPGDMELNSVVARPQPKATGQLAAQRLGSAHVRPLLKPYQQREHPGVYRIAQSLQLVRRGRRQNNRGHAETYYRTLTYLSIIDYNLRSLSRYPSSRPAKAP